MNSRMDRSKLNIGTYTLAPYARTEAHIRDLADCGIDFVVAVDCDGSLLDLFQKYGVGAVPKGIVPGWWGGDGTNAGTMAEQSPPDAYSGDGFCDHPAIWGIDCGDEPSSLDFPHFGKAISAVQQNFPHQFAYLNLYPMYGVSAKGTAEEICRQLGTADYAEYLENYCRNVPLDYICYDFYQYASTPEKALLNLQIAADCAKKQGKSLWLVLQVNSDKENEWISANQLRYQAYSAMAFGAQTIIWACYTAGWWHNHVLDTNGEKTEQYDKLKQVNGEIHKLAEVYMRYRRTETYLINGETTPFAAGDFTDISSDGAFIIGAMTARTGEGTALMVCPSDDPYDKANKKTTLRFRCGKAVRVYDGQGEIPVKKAETGIFELSLRSNQGVFITAE